MTGDPPTRPKRGVARLLGTDHVFFRPLWRRVVIVLFTGAWTAVEFVNGNQMWGFLFGALTAAAIWGFFVEYETDDGG